MKFPKSDRRFSDLIPWPRRLLSGVRKLFLRTAVTSVGALMVGPGILPEGPSPAVPKPQVAVTIVNREKKSSIGKLILNLRNGSGWSMLAGHRSHSSHSSHRSHSSHSSHYSSSRGTAPSAPAPYIPPSPPPAPVKPSSPQGIISTPETTQPIEQVIIEITSIDLERSLITGKDKAGTELVFYFGAFTKVRRLTPQESTRTVAEIGRTSLPLAVNQEVLVAWKAEPEKKRRIVVQFTVY